MGRFVQVRLVIGVVVLGLLAGACGQSPSPGSGAGHSAVATATQTGTETAGPSAAPVSSAEGDVVVPDVSGMNHQDAQNKMQAAGLYNLREVDSTGRHRAMILDRDWCQTGQDPKPGAKVGKQAVITLYARKCDEH